MKLTRIIWLLTGGALFFIGFGAKFPETKRLSTILATICLTLVTAMVFADAGGRD